MPELLVDKTRIPYYVVRSPRRRTVAIEVRSDGRVVVRAPIRTAEASLREFVAQKASWIVRHMREAMQREEAPLVVGQLGASVQVLGEAVPLAVRLVADGRTETSRLEDGVLYVAVVPGADEQTTRDRVQVELERWYRAQAAYHIGERVDLYARQLNVTPRSVRVRHQARRWGSCSAKGALNFNWRLYMAPPDVIDYVVAHEVAHLKVMDHSKRFWTVVDTLYPDHEVSRRWLRREGWRLRL